MKLRVIPENYDEAVARLGARLFRNPKADAQRSVRGVTSAGSRRRFSFGRTRRRVGGATCHPVRFGGVEACVSQGDDGESVGLVLAFIAHSEERAISLGPSVPQAVHEEAGVA